MTDEELVAALAEVLAHETWCNRGAGVLDDDDIACADYRLSTARLLLPTVLRVAEQRAAEAMTETVTKWQFGAWIDLPGQVEQRLASAQFVTEWLRARAAALTATPNHGRNAT